MAFFLIPLDLFNFDKIESCPTSSMISETVMPFFSLHHSLLLAGILIFLGSFGQAAVAATPSLELSGNFTLSGLHNLSNIIFPPSYTITNTNPPITLRIQPTRHAPLIYQKVTYAVVHGLRSLVQDTIRSHGDNAIPENGKLYSWLDTAIYVKSHLPGTLDLTYGNTATLLLGLWELVTLFGAYELDMDVYIGRQDETGYRGQLALYSTIGSRETA